MMPHPMQLKSLVVWPIRLPFKRRFAHAAGEREETLSVLVSVQGADGLVGWGETLPRSYVTGETQDSVLETMRTVWPRALEGFSASSFPQALEKMEALPFFVESAGHGCHAARAAVELALLDLATQHFRQPWSQVGKWVENCGTPLTVAQLPLSHKKRGTVRMSGVLSGGAVDKVLRQMWLLWLWGLRDFKLKVGLPEDDAVLEAIEKRWGQAIRKGSITLRADANGAWTLEEAVRRCKQLSQMGFVSIEEPLQAGGTGILPVQQENDKQDGCPILSETLGRPTFDDRWVELTRLRLLDVMADESLVSRQDAERMVSTHAADAMNIRISKNGGLIPALRLAQLAAAQGKWVQLGCMVGETSILTAAGRVFLSLVPQVRFAEGSYGQWLLKSDVTSNPLKMGLWGRWKPVPGPGWGVNVNKDHIHSLLNAETITLAF